ncbi:arylamine N-acetyltransferase family protein [Gordonia aurantiaca]|uniref:arylamine N-acetyltransferase family protein n=1 Tax=Gordonia sp. B21 TaxID=3151852 RepID=UPI003262D9F6
MRIDGSVTFADLRPRYLERIGVSGEIAESCESDSALLETVLAAQVATVPFENLDIHARRRTDIDPEAVVAKILGRRRGGICYEVNGILALGLAALGFDVRLLGAAVYRPDGGLGLPLGHMAVLASNGTMAWLVDAGFGGSSVILPLGESWEPEPLDVTTSTGRYRTEAVTRSIDEFAPMAHWHSTNPAARFTRSIIVSLTTARQRITLSLSPAAPGAPNGFVLGETDLDTGAATRTPVADDEVCDVLRSRFGIDVPEVPALGVFG